MKPFRLVSFLTIISLVLLSVACTPIDYPASAHGKPKPEAQAPSCVTEPEIVDWVRVSDRAAWNPRDSAVEFSFLGRLWIMGGWFDSFSENPRDVWSSGDGSYWVEDLHEAPWTHGDLAAGSTFRSRMWIFGGRSNGRLAGASSSNQVWSSSDGTNWIKHPEPQWSARVGASVSEFAGRLWLSGGVKSYYFGDATSLFNDVWYSYDGENWSQATANAPWKPRAYHQSVTHSGKLYIVGGGNYVPQYSANNDVWSSVDGERWVQETVAAPWHPRIWFSAMSYRGYIWVLGGWSSEPYKNWNDVWYSRNGRRWVRLATKTQWSPRHEHSAVVHEVGFPRDSRHRDKV